MNPTPLIPFTCAYCHAAFPLPEGGLCGSCRQVFCRKHLRPEFLALAPSQVPDRFYCLDCYPKSGPAE